MNQEDIIRKLRLQLRIERAVIVAAALILFAVWLHGLANNSKSFILIDGKPVVCVNTERDAREMLDKIKSRTGCDPSEIEFRQDVVVARAPRDAQPMSRHLAMRTVQHILSPVAPRWAIIADGKPVVALPSRTLAGEVLDKIKFKFGQMVSNLAEEPQFKEKVTVDIAAVDPSLFCKTPEEAMKFLFDKRACSTTNADYIVRDGDIASSIAAHQGMKLEELWALNPGVNLHKLSIGDKIHIKAIKAPKAKLTVVVRDQSDRTESMAPPTQYVNSAKLYTGKSVELSPGRPGLRQVKVATIYENGCKVGSEILSEEIIRKPIARRIAEGMRRR